MNIRASIARWGNSLAVRIPRDLVARVGLREGSTVDLSVKDQSIVLKPQRYDIRELVAAIAGADPPPLELEDPPVGSETW